MMDADERAVVERRAQEHLAKLKDIIRQHDLRVCATIKGTRYEDALLEMVTDICLLYSQKASDELMASMEPKEKPGTNQDTVRG